MYIFILFSKIFVDLFLLILISLGLFSIYFSCKTTDLQTLGKIKCHYTLDNYQSVNCLTLGLIFFGLVVKSPLVIVLDILLLFTNIVAYHILENECSKKFDKWLNLSKHLIESKN